MMLLWLFPAHMRDSNHLFFVQAESFGAFLYECVLPGQRVLHTSVRAEVWPDVGGTRLFRNGQTDGCNNARLCSIG